MCNNVTISNKWLIMTIFIIVSSAVEMFVAENISLYVIYS